jgi:hypothetical protein
MLSIDIGSIRSIMHTIHAIDRKSISYMLSIDDVCIWYRSTMHVLCYRSMMHNLWWCMLYMLSIDDACYMLSILDDACLCYRSTMHATFYRSMMQVIMLYMMHPIHVIDRWCMLHVIDPWCCLLMLSIYDARYMLLIDNVYTRAISMMHAIYSIDLYDVRHTCYRSVTMHDMLSIYDAICTIHSIIMMLYTTCYLSMRWVMSILSIDDAYCDVACFVSNDRRYLLLISYAD